MYRTLLPKCTPCLSEKGQRPWSDLSHPDKQHQKCPFPFWRKTRREEGEGIATAKLSHKTLYYNKPINIWLCYRIWTMLKAAKCLPEKAMQNNRVTQRALAEAGRAPITAPCPANGGVHAHATYPCQKHRKGVLFQSKVFLDEVCTAERWGTWWHSPFTGMTRAICSCKSEIVPRSCFLPSPPTHEPQQAQPGGFPPILLTWRWGERGDRECSCAATPKTQPICCTR